VPGGCTSDDDCAAGKVCDLATGECGDPNGNGCTSDNDCPTDTLCVAIDGGVCLFACPAFDCTRLGPTWECNGKEHVDGNTVEVCTGT